ncbi:MAG: hypothetical protein ACJAZ0_002844 [Halioglobus sp.]|jgi:hypothetical protein
MAWNRRGQVDIVADKSSKPITSARYGFYALSDLSLENFTPGASCDYSG